MHSVYSEVLWNAQEMYSVVRAPGPVPGAVPRDSRSAKGRSFERPFACMAAMQARLSNEKSPKGKTLDKP